MSWLRLRAPADLSRRRAARSEHKVRSQRTRSTRRALSLQPLEERSLMALAPNALITGAGAGGGPHVRAFDGSPLSEELGLMAYGSFSGGVRVATGDVSGDGVPDIITGAGPGGGPHVRVFDGTTGAQLAGAIGSFFAYSPAFGGGVFVAAGDVTGDGRADVITGAGAGGGPHVRIFNGATGAEVRGFFAYNAAFTGGVHVAAGDVTGDGRVDVITGAGAGGGPHVRIFNGASGAEVRGFFAYDPAFSGGVTVAGADLNDDGQADIITGAGAGGGPHVRAFSGANQTELASFFAYSPAFAGGVNVGGDDLNSDGQADIITGAGPGGGPHVRAFSGANLTELASFFAYSAGFSGGVYVAGVTPPADAEAPTVTAVLANDTGISAADRLTFDATVAGTVTDAGGVGSLRAGFDATPLADFFDVTQDVLAGGAFTLSPARLDQVNGGPLSDGPHTLHLVARDLAGNVSQFDLFFTLDTTLPAAPQFDLDPASDSLPLGDQQTTQNLVTLRGTTEGGVQVEHLQTGNVTVADALGGFFFDGVALAEGANALSTRATDAAGNMAIALQTITVEPPAPLVQFDDPDLAAAVRAALRLPADHVLNRNDLAPLSQLSADSNRIDSLTGLEWAVNLQSLSLMPSNYAAPGLLGDLAPLSGLAQLSSLALVGAGLSHLELATLGPSNVETLDVRYNDLTSVDALAGLPMLQTVLLYGNPLTNLSPLAGRPLAVDLQGVDVAQADTVPEIAAALRNLPLELLEYVANNIEHVAYAGSQKGAQATLETKAGNAWDQATLLIELLAAAGVNARYVSGRVEVTHEMAQQWLGTRNASAALTVLAAAGLNGDGDTPGVLVFDHVWVEAELLVPGGGLTWVAMDPSWKFKDRQAGIQGLLGLVPFDRSEYLAQLRPERAYEFYEQQVADFLQANMPGKSVADVPFDGPIIPQRFDALPASLPYTVRGATTATTDVPAVMEQRAELTLKMGATELFTRTFVLPDMSLSRVTVGFTDAGGGNLSPQLRLDGGVVVIGSTVPEDSTLALEVRSFEPGDNTVDHTWTATFRAGDYVAVGLDVNQSSHRSLIRQQEIVNQAAINAVNGIAVSQEEQIGALLALGISKFFFEFELGRDVINDLAGYRSAYRGMEFGVTTSKTEVNFFQDLQIPFVPKGASVDVPGAISHGVPIDNDFSQSDIKFRLGGISSSSQEHALWEELLNTTSISTVKSLQVASSLGIPVFTIDSSNKDTVLPQLTLPASDIATISDAVDAGATVITPRDITPLNDWSGVGYIVDSGNSIGYLISGGLNAADRLVRHGGSVTDDPNNRPPNPDCSTCGQTTTGKPVNIANGNESLEQTDIDLPGIGLPLRFERHYDSQSTADRGLGLGWLHSYSDFLTFNPDQSITWTNQHGHRHMFEPDGLGGFMGEQELSGSFTATGPGFEFRYNDGATFRFNAEGQFTELLDRYGNSLTLAYDGLGQLASVTDTDAPSRQLTFTFDGGHLISVSDFTGRTWSYSYAATLLVQVSGPADATAAAAIWQFEYFTDTARAGLLSRIRQPDGGSYELTYFTNRRVFQETDPEGFEMAFSHDFFRRQTTVVDARDNPTVYGYDDEGHMIRKLHPDRSEETFVWQDGLQVSKIDAFGQGETYEYDGRSNMTRMVDRAGIVTQYTYDPVFSNVTSITRTGGRVATYSYDALGNLIERVDPLGNRTTYTYDALGQKLTETRPKGNLTATPGDFTTTFAYNNAGQVTSISTDLPSSESFAYDTRGNVSSHTDANGNTIQFTYDVRDNPISTTDPLFQTRTSTFDAIDNLTSTTDELGRVTQYTYDLRQLRTSTTLPDNTQMVYAYDAASNRVAWQDELGRLNQNVFDSRNRLVNAVYADGTSSQQSFDGDNRRTEVVDERGNTTRFFYDAAGRPIRTTDAVGNSSLMSYDLVGNVATTTDRRGAVTTFTYDLLDRVTQERGPEGFVTTTDYDANSNPILVTRYDITGLGSIPADPRTLPANLHRSTQYVYDVLDRPIERIDPLGQSRHTDYDAGGRVTQSTDELGRITRFAYDGLDRVITFTDAIGGIVANSYDAVDNLLTVTDQRNHTTSYAYDVRNRRVTATDALNGVSSVAYDAVGNVVASSDELGRITRYDYDARDRRTSTVDALGGRTAFAYDAAGNQISTTDELGRDTLYGYDALNRLDAMLAADGGLTNYGYDPEGNLLSVNDPLAHITSYTYDLRGRRTGMTDARSSTSATVYDALDNVSSSTDELGRMTTYQYDRLNRRTLATSPLSNPTSYEYDAVGNQTAIVDALGHRSESVFDALNRQTQQIDANGDATLFAYDGVDNLTRVTDPEGNRTNFVFDELDRLTTDTNELGATRTYQYDAVDNHIAITDRNGRLRQFRYDALNRLTEERWLDGLGAPVNVINFSFDAADQLTAARDAASVYPFTYDAVGRMLSVNNQYGPGTLDVLFTYTYDVAGNQRSRSDQLGPIFNSQNLYTYDELDRPTQITQNVGGTINKRIDMAYDAASQMTGLTRFADGAGTQLIASSASTYDLDGRLTQLRHFRGAATLAQYDYVFDAADRITQITSAADGSSSFSYDDRDQLTSADHSFQGDEAYAYDDNGNRTNAGYATTADNRLASDGVFNYQYDAEGNRTRRTRIASGEVTDYAWDHRNRLTRVVVSDSSGEVVRQIDYEYDLLDRRIARRVDLDGGGPATATAEQFVYDGMHIAFTFDAAGVPIHRYLHGPLVDQVLADEDEFGDVLWPLADHQGTVRDLLDSLGQVQNHRRYDSFGRMTSETNAAVDHLFGYTGRELDEETGLAYYRARYYDPAVGRFLSEDPIGFAAGDANLYRYVGNSPTLRTDPSGLDSGFQPNTTSVDRSPTTAEASYDPMYKPKQEPPKGGNLRVYRESTWALHHVIMVDTSKGPYILEFGIGDIGDASDYYYANSLAIATKIFIITAPGKVQITPAKDVGGKDQYTEWLTYGAGREITLAEGDAILARARHLQQEVEKAPWWDLESRYSIIPYLGESCSSFLEEIDVDQDWYPTPWR